MWWFSFVDIGLASAKLTRSIHHSAVTSIISSHSVLCVYQKQCQVPDTGMASVQTVPNSFSSEYPDYNIIWTSSGTDWEWLCLLGPKLYQLLLQMLREHTLSEGGTLVSLVPCWWRPRELLRHHQSSRAWSAVPVMWASSPASSFPSTLTNSLHTNPRLLGKQVVGVQKNKENKE